MPHPTRLVLLVLAAAGLPACVGVARPAPTALHLDRVVLYQSGIGHFERSGKLTGDRLILRLRPHEVDDVIKTLTVVDVAGVAQQVAAVLPTPDQSATDHVDVEVVLSQPGRALQVSYAVPTAAWKTTYRLAMPAEPGQPVLLQSWAMIDNVSEESWDKVALTLATGAPLSFATDLRTPHFVPRPDATGALLEPTVQAAIVAERSRSAAGDRDADGILDQADICPDASEDRDGDGDDDGCPDADNDHDAIPDVDDKCPDEPETANGLDDDDGCPDRGRVVVTDTNIEILDNIYFPGDDAGLRPQAQPIIDAVAATLRGNPDITKLEIGGHASTDERDPWGLSARRAAAVRAALLAAGVRTELVVQPYGASQPLDPRSSAKNQRASFLILTRRDSEAPGRRPAGPRLDATTLATAAPGRSEVVEVAGATRYQLDDRVTVPRGASTLVSVLSRKVEGEEILLYRPDPGAPASSRNPFRAARFALPAGLGLEPGPVAVFADGSFAGEGLLRRLHGGEVGYVPFALDGGTTVEVAAAGADEPQRLLTVARGVATVEDSAVQRTTYTVHAGATARGRIFFRHVPTPGYTLGELPPGTEPTDGALLVPLPLTAGRTSTLVIEERRPVQRRLELVAAGDVELAAYLEGAHLSGAVLAQAQAVVSARGRLATSEQAQAGLREQLAVVSDRAAELQDTLRTTAKLTGPQAAELRKRLLMRLDTASAETDRLAVALAAETAQGADARIALETAIASLGLEMTASPLAAPPPR